MASLWTKDDFLRVRWAALAALLMAVAGATILYLAHHVRTLTAVDHANAVGQHRDVMGKLSRTLEEEAELRGLSSRWEELSRAGLVGEERRLEWVELIRGLRTRHGIPDLQYEIFPQQPADPLLIPGGNAGRLEFRSSRMQIALMLRHEGQLLDFLRDLHSAGRGYPMVRNCRLERLGAASPASAPGARLRGECNVEWITIRDKSGAAT